MSRKQLCFIGLLMLVGAASAPSIVAQETIGYISFDAVASDQAEFDITNVTGVNSFISPDVNPVTTSVSLSDLNLVVSFASGPTETFGSSYFTLNADGISWDGTPASTSVGQPSGLNGAVSAVLTGDFSTTTLTLMDGSTVTVDPSFSATISDSAGLTDGDLAIITAINRKPVTDEASYRAIVSTLKSKDDVVFVVQSPTQKSLNSYIGGTLP